MNARRAASATEAVPRCKFRWEGAARGFLPEGGALMPVIQHYRIWRSAPWMAISDPAEAVRPVHSTRLLSFHPAPTIRNQ